jgi:putative methyltransferase (TIGR04325 family)
MGRPAGLAWTVCDVPAVVEAGRRIAGERGADAQLRFTSDYGALSGQQVLYASGALQYLPMTLPEWIRGLIEPPPHVVLNTTPLHAQRGFFTLNSIGAGFCPYRVIHDATLVRELDTLGYKVVDRWSNPGKRLEIPFETGYGVPEYRGMYLRRI